MTGARPVLALDASVAIALDRLGYIETLRQIGEVVLTPAVVRELRAGADKPGGSVPDLPWIEVKAPATRELDEVVRGLEAHEGERETLALSLNGTVVPVVDDEAARRYAKERGVVTSSTLALLVRLHELGLGARPVEEDLARLTAGGMYFTEQLRAWTVEQVQRAGPPRAEEGDVGR